MAHKSHNKESRQQVAQLNAEARGKLSIKEQLSILSTRPGRSEREVTRLIGLLPKNAQRAYRKLFNSLA